VYTKANLDEITSLIQVYIPEVDSIYLFGSYSKGAAREDSDIDITIIMNSELQWRERKKILNNLYRETGRRGFDVDFRENSGCISEY